MSDAVNGNLSFPKWALGIFTVTFIAGVGWGFTSLNNQVAVNAVQAEQIKQLQEYYIDMRDNYRDVKDQLNRMEANQQDQNQTQKFILQNMATVTVRPK